MTRPVSPYPPSPAIARLEWAPDTVRLGGERTGDNWPMAWGDDDRVYTAYGDGNGFGPRPTMFTLGFAAVSGRPPTHSARDLSTDIDTPVGWGKEGIKASGLLMVDGVLYLYVRNVVVDGDWHHARLAWSADHGHTWTWAEWTFTETFGCPEFVQFGPDYAHARDGYVYIVSQDGNSAYDFDPGIVMARVPRKRVPDRAAYQFYAGADRSGTPTWSPHIGDRQPIFFDPRGTQRIAITHNRALGRYFLTTAHGVCMANSVGPATHTSALGVFDAPEPWGPWTTVYDDAYWAEGWMIHHKFPTPWMSDNGLEMWLAFSGQYRPGGQDYCLLARKAILTLAAPTDRS